MKVIMVCGKYRASTVPEISDNINKAKHVAIELWQKGFAVICPHTNSAHFDGFCEDEVWLKGYQEILKRCDAIFVLKGHENSSGTTNEIKLAKQLGKEIIYE